MRISAVGAYSLLYDGVASHHPWSSYSVVLIDSSLSLVSHIPVLVVSCKLISLSMFHPVVCRACCRCLGFVGRRMIVWVVRFIVQWFLSCRFDGGNAMALSCAADCASALPCFLFGW